MLDSGLYFTFLWSPVSHSVRAMSQNYPYSRLVVKTQWQWKWTVLPAPEASTTRDLDWERPGLGEQVLPWGRPLPPGAAFCAQSSPAALMSHPAQAEAGSLQRWLVLAQWVDGWVIVSQHLWDKPRLRTSPALQRSAASPASHRGRCSAAALDAKGGLCLFWGPGWGVGREYLCGSSGSFNF